MDDELLKRNESACGEVEPVHDVAEWLGCVFLGKAVEKWREATVEKVKASMGRQR